MLYAGPYKNTLSASITDFVEMFHMHKVTVTVVQGLDQKGFIVSKVLGSAVFLLLWKRTAEKAYSEKDSFCCVVPSTRDPLSQ